MYILLQNDQSVTAATKVVRNLPNIEDVLSLRYPVLIKCSGKIQKYAEIY